MANDFQNRPNSQVEYRTPEEMAQYQANLIIAGLKLLEYKPKVVSSPTELPFTVSSKVAVEYFNDLQTFLVNVTGQELVKGFLEELKRIEPILTGTPYLNMCVTIAKYEKFLADTSENCSILAEKLGIK